MGITNYFRTALFFIALPYCIAIVWTCCRATFALAGTAGLFVFSFSHQRRGTYSICGVFCDGPDDTKASSEPE
jgi:hypothetical protein